MCSFARISTYSLLLSLVAIAAGQFSPRTDYRSGFLVQNPCVSKQTCSECLQTPTCAWCMKEVRLVFGPPTILFINQNSSLSQEYTSVDGSALPRCNQESYYSSFQGGSNRVRCPADQVVNPDNVFNIIENTELRKASTYSEAVQVKPQHVSLKLRISKFPAISLKITSLFKHWLFCLFFDYLLSLWLLFHSPENQEFIWFFFLIIGCHFP